MSTIEIFACIATGVGVFMICIYFISLISKLHKWALNKWMNLEPSVIILISVWIIILFSLFFGSAVFYRFYLIWHGQ